MAKVSDVVSSAESIWPANLADDWDRPGLISGSFDITVSKVLLAIDLTIDVIDEAIAGGFEMVLTHHPFLLKGVYDLRDDSAKGSVLGRAIRANIALFSAHTNADVVQSGVSAVLAGALGLRGAEPLVATADAQTGHGRIGELDSAMTLLQFARRIAAALPPTAGGIRVAGNSSSTVKRVALCAGAGGSFFADALASDADVYVTSDLRHHAVQDALEQARASERIFSVIDISHWAAESLWLDVAAIQLSEAVSDVKFVVSDLRTDSWDFAVTQ